MHKKCGETFSGFHRNSVHILESVRFRTTFFSNYLFFRTEAENDNGQEGCGVAKGEGRKEVEQ